MPLDPNGADEIKESGTSEKAAPDTAQETKSKQSGAPDVAKKPGAGRPGAPATVHKTGTSRMVTPTASKTPGTVKSSAPTAAQKAGAGQQSASAAAQKTGTSRAGTPSTAKTPGTVKSSAPTAAQKTGSGQQSASTAAKKAGTGQQSASTAAQKTGTSRGGAPDLQKRPETGAANARRNTEPSPRRQALPSAKSVNSADADAEQVHNQDISPDGALTEHTEPNLDTGSAKFKVKFDFDGTYKDVPEVRPIRLRRERRTGCVGGILYAAFVICVSLVLASLVWMCTVDVLGFGAEDEQVNITVPQGFEIDDITERLYDAGLIRYKFLFNLYAGYSNAEDKITAGTYVLNMSFDYRALVQGMTARAGERVETTVTIPEGYTLAQIFALLVDYGVCQSEDDLWKTAKSHDFKFSFLDDVPLGNELRLEGFMFPETYNFYLDSTPVQAITKFLREFDKRFTEQYTERAEYMEYSVRDIIIVASMIEREAGSDEERPRIAAVIYNRLDSNDFPHLQIDATIHYAIAGTGRTFSLDIDSPYNSYVHEGLPPGPIANPGIESIRAALYPESTNEYYYALNRSGTHNFFRNDSQHDAFVQSDEYGGR